MENCTKILKGIKTLKLSDGEIKRFLDYIDSSNDFIVPNDAFLTINLPLHMVENTTLLMSSAGLLDVYSAPQIDDETLTEMAVSGIHEYSNLVTIPDFRIINKIIFKKSNK